LEEELHLLQQQGIITPVTEATQWCASIAVTPKKGTECARMCVDLSKLNKFAVRERYIYTTPAEVVAGIAAQEDKYFKVIDAAKGYHQCPLASESPEFTERFDGYLIMLHDLIKTHKFCLDTCVQKGLHSLLLMGLQAPYGLSSIAEHYNHCIAEALEGLTGY